MANESKICIKKIIWKNKWGDEWSKECLTNTISRGIEPLVLAHCNILQNEYVTIVSMAKNKMGQLEKPTSIVSLGWVLVHT